MALGEGVLEILNVQIVVHRIGSVTLFFLLLMRVHRLKTFFLLPLRNGVEVLARKYIIEG